MDYETACEAEVTRAEAKREIEKHAVRAALGTAMWAEFIDDVGNRETYRGSDVLDWLGY